MKTTNTDTQNHSLWLYYWYATLLPLFIGLTLGYLSYKESNPALANIEAVFAACLIGGQILAWILWRFSEKGTSDKWLVVKDGPSQAVVLTTEPRGIMVPRLKIGGKEKLAITESTIPLVQQLSFGSGPFTQDEIGHELRTAIEYTEMTQADINTYVNSPLGYKACRVNDPFNCSTSNARPKIKVDVRVRNAQPIIRVKELKIAAGQLADKLAMYYQARVAGMSAAFINANADLIGKQLDADMKDELRHRGLVVEEQNGFTVVDHGVPETLRAAVSRKAVVEREGDANIAAATKDADAKVETARGIVTLAKAEGDADTERGRGVAAAFAARFAAMTAVKITPARIADILQQEAVRSGLPVIAKGVRDVILQIGRGGNPIELWRELGESSDGHPADRSRARA